MEERDYQSLLVEQDGFIVTLTFNKPEKKNPLSQELVNELLWALDDAEDDLLLRDRPSVLVADRHRHRSGPGGRGRQGEDHRGEEEPTPHRRRS